MQLEMFVAMVEEGNFRRAAERVCRTQPALSMALRKLEGEIGAPLFDRSNRTAYTLTDVGELLYSRAKKMIELRDETALALQRLRNLQSGSIRIGANESACLYLLPHLIQAFHRQHPEIEVEVFRHLSHELIGELRARRIDFGILAFRPDEDDLEATAVMHDEMILILSPDHPLAERDGVHVRDLGGERLASLNLRDAFYRRTAEAFRRFETPMNITMRVDTFEEVKKLVAMNLAVAMAPRMCVTEELRRRELVSVPLDGLRYERTLWLVRRATEAHSFATRAFTQLAEQVSEQISQPVDSRRRNSGRRGKPAEVINIQTHRVEG